MIFSYLHILMLPVSRKNYFPNFFLIILSAYQSQISDQKYCCKGKAGSCRSSIDRMKKVEVSFLFIPFIILLHKLFERILKHAFVTY